MALVLSVIGCVASYVPVRGSGGKTIWWSLRPSSSEVDVQAHVSAMSILERGLRRRSVTLVREGEEGETARLWIGVTNSPEPEKLAQAIARAGGCELDSEAEPPDPDRPWRWWVSSPRVRAVKSPSQQRRQPVDPTRFPDHANRFLEPGDLLVITARPSKDDRHTVKAAGMSTRKTMASSWYPNLPLKAHHIWPHPAALLSAAGVLIGIFAVLLGRFEPSQYQIVYIMVIPPLGVFGVWRARHKRPLARRMRLKGPVPVPFEKGRLISRLYKQRSRPAPIPVSQVAGWASGGNLRR